MDRRTGVKDVAIMAAFLLSSLQRMLVICQLRTSAAKSRYEQFVKEAFALRSSAGK